MSFIWRQDVWRFNKTPIAKIFLIEGVKSALNLREYHTDKRGMKLFYAPGAAAFFTVFFMAAFFFSCAAAPPERIPEKPPIPPAPEYIMGGGRVPAETLARFLTRHNPEADAAFAAGLADYYTEEAAAEGVNHDVAFAQMCLDTGFLRYGGLVSPEMNNFCGLGSTGPGHPGEVFPDPRTGVRAHVQHLKGYASSAPLNRELVDPRYRWVRYGSSPLIQGLAGTWAADTAYGDKIAAILERLYRFAFG